MYARNILAILTLSLTVGAGCDVEVLEDGGEASTVKRSGSGGYGGVWLNTSAIGSQPFSEMDLAGALHDGVQVTGVKVKGANNSWILADKTEVADGTLRIKVGKTVYSGAALVGARWQINLVNDGKCKVEANRYEPLSEEARAAIQSRVDDYYDAFTRDVARHRGVTQTQVQGGFGQGRVVGAKEAVSLGMADRVGAPLTRGSGQSAEAYAAQHLFGPLGITAHRWLRDPQGVSTGGWCLYLRTRDMARLGQL